MKQKDYVIKAMEENGGYATFKQLNQTVDVSTWGTKTPYASIRRIVQTNDDFFKIQPGLWALKAYESEVLRKFQIRRNQPESEERFTHSYFQGIITEIGNIRNFKTFVPAQDKNKLFLERKLGDIASTTSVFNFTYPGIVQKAKTVDAIWFNERYLPNSFFEVEHTTNIRNSLDKFYELQDFRADFVIVAAKTRERQFEDIISSSIYLPIKDNVRFVDYDKLIAQYEYESRQIERVI